MNRQGKCITKFLYSKKYCTIAALDHLNSVKVPALNKQVVLSLRHCADLGIFIY